MKRPKKFNDWIYKKQTNYERIHKKKKRRELQAKTQDKFNYTNFLFYEACQS